MKKTCYNLINYGCILVVSALFALELLGHGGPNFQGVQLPLAILPVPFVIIYFIGLSIPKLKKYIHYGNLFLFVYLVTVYFYFGTFKYPLELLGYYWVITIFLVLKFISQDTADTYKALKIIFILVMLVQTGYIIYVDYNLLTANFSYQSLYLIVNIVYAFLLFGHLSIKDTDYISTTKK